MNLKTILFKLTFLILLVILSGCGGGGDSATEAIDDTTPTGTATPSLSSSLYGAWKYIDTAEEIEIVSTTRFYSHTLTSDNLLEITEQDGTVRHLLRASVANTNTKGVVVDAQSASQVAIRRSSSLNGIGGIEVVLKNIKDPKVTTRVTSDSKGDFTDTTLPSGTYTIVGTDGIDSFETSVTLDGVSTDLGNFSMPDASGYNFKTELILNDKYIYTDGSTYNGFIRVKNIGSEDGLGLSYSVTLNDYYLKSFDKTVTLGTVVAGSVKDIPISFSFNEILAATRTASIETTITDVVGNTWSDSFNINLFRRNMNISLKSAVASVKGYVVMQGHDVIPFNLTGYNSPTLGSYNR